MLGEDAAPVAIPIPWGGILVLGVLAVGLVALGGETASSPRTRKMRANGKKTRLQDAREMGFYAGQDEAPRWQGSSSQGLSGRLHSRGQRLAASLGYDEREEKNAFAFAYEDGVSDVLNDSRAPRDDDWDD